MVAPESTRETVTKIPEDVKPRRADLAERRREQARGDAAAVLAAAARLFTERGYESATITGIAEAADVSPETIHATFRNKRSLLAELVGSAVRGGDDAPVLGTAGPRAMAAGNRSARAAAPLRCGHRSAPRARQSAPRSAPDGIAPTPSSPSCARRSTRAAARASDQFISGSGRATARSDSEPDAATDDAWALASPELHQLLTRTRGWDTRALLRLARRQPHGAAAAVRPPAAFAFGVWPRPERA